jgi:hypothetical protein
MSLRRFAKSFRQALSDERGQRQIRDLRPLRNTLDRSAELSAEQAPAGGATPEQVVEAYDRAG